MNVSRVSLCASRGLPFADDVLLNQDCCSGTCLRENKKHGFKLLMAVVASRVEAGFVEKFLWEPSGGNQAPDRLRVYVKTGICWKT
jgi:hypothetical protein